MCFTALGNANDTKEQDVFICGNDIPLQWKLEKS